jgi:hypothetical protein
MDNPWVDITFDCLPLRSVTRLDIPLDASPKYRARCERLKAAIEKHGVHNAYYLYNAQCKFHVVNHPDRGALIYQFEGTVLTDSSDVRTQHCDLQVSLVGETCPWLNETVKEWFAETTVHAVAVEFDRYIAAGDLERTRERLAKLEQQMEQAGGFVGMYL